MIEFLNGSEKQVEEEFPEDDKVLQTILKKLQNEETKLGRFSF